MFSFQNKYLSCTENFLSYKLWAKSYFLKHSSGTIKQFGQLVEALSFEAKQGYFKRVTKNLVHSWDVKYKKFEAYGRLGGI